MWGAEGFRDEELDNENRRLERVLEEQELYLLELKKAAMRQPVPFNPTRMNLINKEANSLGDINLQANRNKANDILSCYLKYCGIVVKEYSENNCAVAFGISIGGKCVAQYAVRLNSIPGTNDWVLKEYHLPEGFSPDIVSEKSEVMTKDYFHFMHQALTALHDRLFQISELKKILPSHVLIFHSADGSIIELNLRVHQNNENAMNVLCILKYDKFKIRPNSVDVTKSGICNQEDIESLKAQLEPFSIIKLQDAFRSALQKKDSEYFCPSDDGLENFETAKLQKNKSMKKQMYTRNISNHENQERPDVLNQRQNCPKQRQKGAVLGKDIDRNPRAFGSSQTNIENNLDSSTSSKYSVVGRFKPTTHFKNQGRKIRKTKNNKGRNVSQDDTQ